MNAETEMIAARVMIVTSAVKELNVKELIVFVVKGGHIPSLDGLLRPPPIVRPTRRGSVMTVRVFCPKINRCASL
jgi:hypothetical protein